ncbi:MAG: DUF5723 family protein [Flavobacteriales bacterium]
MMYSVFSLGQTNSGITEDNFNGIHGILTNPSNVVDSRVKFELNLASISFFLANDYTPLTFTNVFDILGGNDIMGEATDDNNVLFNVDVLAPSLMFNINKKSSIGITTRVRGILEYNNINGDLIQSINNGFPMEDYNFEIRNTDQSVHAWGEVGLTYGRILLSKGEHFIKGGITLKYLLGGGVEQVSSNSVIGSYEYSGDNLNLKGDFSTGTSYDSETFEKLTPGFGSDIGFVYEFRPQASYYSINDTINKGVNKYKLKLGVSVLDIGAITYKDLEQKTYNLDGTIKGIDAEEDFVQTLEENFTPITTVSDQKVLLPTTLQINVDYRLSKRFYTSINYNQSMVGKDEPYANNGLNLLTFAPRFESRYFSFHLPIGYSKLGKTSFGVGLRMGPLTVGSSTMLSSLLSEKAYLGNLYVGLKIPVYQKDQVKAKIRTDKRVKNKEEKKAKKSKDETMGKNNFKI